MNILRRRVNSNRRIKYKLSSKRFYYTDAKYPIGYSKGLAYQMIQNKNQKESTHHVLFEHGILSNSRSWIPFIEKFVDKNPNYSCLIVDFPYHGNSTPNSGGMNCDIQSISHLMNELVDDLFYKNNKKLDVICAHSYGGKVAMTMTQLLEKKRKPVPTELWILDSFPVSRSYGNIKLDGAKILDIVRQVPSSFSTRKEAVERLMKHGLSKEVSLGMTTTLINKDNKFVWEFNIEKVYDMYLSYMEDSFLPYLSNPNATNRYILGNTDRWTDALMADMKRAAKQSQGKTLLYNLNCGHNFHIENPAELLKLLSTFTIPQK